jgi:hypothetical protein
MHSLIITDGSLQKVGQGTKHLFTPPPELLLLLLPPAAALFLLWACIVGCRSFLAPII